MGCGQSPIRKGHETAPGPLASVSCQVIESTAYMRISSRKGSRGVMLAMNARPIQVGHQKWKWKGKGKWSLVRVVVYELGHHLVSIHSRLPLQG